MKYFTWFEAYVANKMDFYCEYLDFIILPDFIMILILKWWYLFMFLVLTRLLLLIWLALLVGQIILMYLWKAQPDLVFNM